MNGPLVEALGWALFYFIWEGVIIALLFAACPTRSARLRYALACAALAAMLIAFIATFLWMLPTPGAAAAPLHPGPLPGLHLTLTPAPQSWTTPLAERLPRTIPFWLAGVLLVYLRNAAAWWAARRLRRAGVCAAPPVWLRRLHHLQRRLALSKPVALLESALVEVPVIIGHLRPVILIPVGLLTALDPAQIECILLHELAHIRRHDYLVNLLQKCVEGLLFYHPAVWWVSQQISTEREHCCDDIVVSLQGNSLGYAAALAALEQTRWPAREPALAATGGTLMKRIRRILQGPDAVRSAIGPVFSTGLLLAAIALVLVAWNPKLVAFQTTTLNPIYANWLDEVSPIMNDLERNAFLRLNTDEERNQFITQFWQRCDPTHSTAESQADQFITQPGSENAFKKEYYRRLAYAKERFASDSTPGWKTDRGITYLRFGPPDEIESHLAGDAGSQAPYEMWFYRPTDDSRQLIVRFTDENRTGDYKLAGDAKQVLGLATPGQIPQQIRVGANVMAQKLINKVDPLYPPLALQARIQGIVRLSIVIDKDGRVSHAKVISGHPLLMQAAIDAVRRWLYSPTLLNGVPVEVSTTVDVPFMLP